MLSLEEWQIIGFNRWQEAEEQDKLIFVQGCVCGMHNQCTGHAIMYEPAKDGKGPKHGMFPAINFNAEWKARLMKEIPEW